ncbi:MAG: MarR family transcriptional regulator [Methylophaga sp.]|nr:MarR family transcriptional regulator [Methylophaga sp.]
MLQLKDLPNAEILSKFAERYPDADIHKVLQFLTVLRIGSDLSLMLDNFLAGYGLLQGRWWVLILLMREADLTTTPSILASKAGVSRATMTGLLDGLEREGLVSRVTDKRDRRRLAIQLTTAGQAKLDQVMPDYYQRVNALMDSLSSAEAEELIQSLKSLHSQQTVFE